MAEEACPFCVAVEASDASLVTEMGSASTSDAASGLWALPPAYATLLSLGLIMIVAHCAGMCGPLLLSFRFGMQQDTRAGRLWAAGRQLLAYQASRALLYALFGAVAGGVGGVLGNDFAKSLTGGLGLLAPVIAIAFLAAAVWKGLGPKPVAAPTGAGRIGGLARAGLVWQQKLAAYPTLRAAGLGALMAFLPCMVTAWVLLLATSTGSLVHGAMLMVLLVVLTTPALLPFAITPSMLPRLRARWGDRLQVAGLVFSALWMGLISLAANDVIGHAQFRFGEVTVMFF